VIGYLLQNRYPSGAAIADYSETIERGIVSGVDGDKPATRWMAAVMAVRAGRE